MADNSKVKRALELVAEQNGVTVEEVRSEIQAFIRETSPELLVALVANLIKEQTPVV